jgi:hypothetical protein
MYSGTLAPEAGLPDFCRHNIPKRGKIYQITTLPNGHKIYPITLKYTSLSILRPSKIYQNWDFWFENKPSGNPALK